MCPMGKKTVTKCKEEITGKAFQVNRISDKEILAYWHKSSTKGRLLFSSQKDFPTCSSSNEFHCVLKIGFTPNFSVTHKGMLVNLLK